MYAFNYHRPSSARQAATLLTKKEEAKLLAGGQTLLPAMKLRLASPGNIVDLRDAVDLKGIVRKGRSLVIGAMETHAAVAGSDVVQEAIPGLAAMAHGIGDPHVRSRGTIGGSLANNDPAADYPAAVLALDAVIVTNKRKITADDFFQGLFTTALEDGEIITKVSFLVPSKFAYEKFRHPASRFAIVGVAVAKRGSSIRVAVTGSGSDGVFRWSEAEAALAKRFGPKSLDGLGVDASLMASDIHADAAYRAHLVGVIARRAVAKAAGK